MRLSPLFFFALLLLFFTCNPKESKKTEVQEINSTKNEVIVLGTVHGSHLTEAEYSIEVLTDIIKKIDPDIILTEIPPDRFPVGMMEFTKTDTIKEPRIIRFPEYIDVIFPLSKEMSIRQKLKSCL